MSPEGTKVVGYVRVSTQEQADSGAGLAAQRAAIETEATRRGWQLVTILEDRGLSAKSTKGRVAYEAAIAMIEAGAADALVVAKLDRLSRSMQDFVNLMEQAKKNHWAIVVLDCDFDMTTPAGELMVTMLAAFAQFERRIISQRTKDGLAQKKLEGIRSGRRSGLSDRVVSRISRERDAGRSYGTIAADLNADAIPTSQGGKAWHASTVRQILFPARPDRSGSS